MPNLKLVGVVAAVVLAFVAGLAGWYFSSVLDVRPVETVAALALVPFAAAIIASFMTILIIDDAEEHA